MTVPNDAPQANLTEYLSITEVAKVAAPSKAWPSGGVRCKHDRHLYTIEIDLVSLLDILDGVVEYDVICCLIGGGVKFASGLADLDIQPTRPTYLAGCACPV